MPILIVESDAFRSNGRLPPPHTGKDGRSPDLRWSPVPPGTREVVVLCEDPDATMPRPFVHWIVTGIPPEVNELHEGLPPTSIPLATGMRQGKNSARQDGYMGPAPPPGRGVHHYHFQVFALDARLDAHARLERDELVEAMRDHVLALGEIVGTHER